MWAVLNRMWRIAATGLSFSVFGLGGVIMPVLVAPIIYLSTRDQRTRERRAKAFVSFLMRSFVRIMHGLGVLSYQIGDKTQYNRPGHLVLANHPTLIDTVFLIAFVPNADCVVKGALKRNPFTRIPIGLAGYIANDDPEGVIVEAAASLARGNSLIIFPEGTRTTPGQPIKLRRGAANIAVRTNAPIAPVVSRCDPITLTKGEPWYRVPKTKPHFSYTVRPSIHVADVIGQNSASLAARNLTKYLHNYFTQELSLNEQPRA
ncbi:lysophospholipid acyltransferase family protein [Aurantivibrio plasticivorans]